ncbi:MAG: DUF2723 domain-containing protein [Nitrospiraceae bacterium]|nr:DUF2723 domain-containing protein [Nitrospiraceae bacterium]
MAQIAGFLAVFIISLFNLAPVIYVADSPLFTNASYFLSTAHPPGYPLWATIGKLFTFIPFSSIAWRTNLVSAVFESLSYVVLFRLIELVTNNKKLAFSFSFLPVLTHLGFKEALIAETFAMNAFFCLLVLYFGIRAYQEDDARFLYIVSFLFGLGSGNHHTLALLIFPVLLPFTLILIKNRKASVIPLSFVFFFSGFLINLHIYLRSVAIANSAYIYSIGNSFDGFLNVFLRRGYNTNSTEALKALGGLQNSAPLYFYGFINTVKYVISRNYGPAITGLFFFSALVLFFLPEKKSLKIYMSLALFPWLFLLPRMTVPANIIDYKTMLIVARFFLPLLFFVPLVISIPVNRLFIFLKKLNPGIFKMAQVFLIVPLVYTPTIFKSTIKNDFVAYDRGRDSLSVLPVKSLFILYGDNPTFTTFYTQWVERYREDVTTFNRIRGLDTFAIIGRSSFIYNHVLGQDYIKEIKGRRIIVTSKLNGLADNEKFYATGPGALIYQLKSGYRTSFSGPLDYMVLHKNSPDSPETDFLINNFQKLNYERALPLYSDDLFVDEIKNQYGFTLLTTLPFIKEPGKQDRILNASLKLVIPERFLPYYTHILVSDGKETKARDFIKWIENRLPVSKMADIAHVMEYLLDRQTDGNAARTDYAYLKEHDLLKYLAAVKGIYDNMK